MGLPDGSGQVSDPEEMSQRMAQCLRLRGPGGQGIYLKRDVCLVHTRLNILDLSLTGARPMVNEDGIVWTIFNSEIYNYHDLRRLRLVDDSARTGRFTARFQVLSLCRRAYAPRLTVLKTSN